MKRIKKIILRSLTYILGLTAVSETNAGILKVSIDNETNQEIYLVGKVTDYSEIKQIAPTSIKETEKLKPGQQILFQVNIIVKKFVDEGHFKYAEEPEKIGVDLHPDKKDGILWDTPNGPLEIIFDRDNEDFSVIFEPFIKKKPKDYQVNIVPDENGRSIYHVIILEEKLRSKYY